MPTNLLEGDLYKPGTLTGQTGPMAPPKFNKLPDAPNFKSRDMKVSVSSPGQRGSALQDTPFQEKAEAFKPGEGIFTEDRLTNLLSKDSDYLKQARYSAEAAANRRGLLNSSIAAGAGTSAAIQSALPIASQDAATMTGFERARQGFTQQQAISEQQFGQNAELANQAAKHRSILSAQEASQQGGLIRVKGLTDQALQGDRAAQNLVLQYQQDLGQLERQLVGIQGESQLSAQNSLQQKALQGQIDKAQLDRMVAKGEIDANLAEQQYGFQRDLQVLDQNSRERLLNVQQQYGMLLQQSQAASNRFQDLAQQMAAITTNPDLKPEQKNTAIKNLEAYMQASMNTQAEFMKAAGIEGFSVGNVAGGGGEFSTGATSVSGGPAQQQLSPESQSAIEYERLWGTSMEADRDRALELRLTIQNKQTQLNSIPNNRAYTQERRDILAEIERMKKEYEEVSKRLA